MIENIALQEEVRAHFNEPVLNCRLQVGRCIGYAEDNVDCYIILQFPGDKEPKIVWSTMVGGYYFLNALKLQNCCIGPENEQWSDLSRLCSDLTRAGVPKAEEFKIIYQDDDGGI